MGALEPNIPLVDPSECSFQDAVLPSDDDLLEVINNLYIPLDVVSIVLCHDHIF